MWKHCQNITITTTCKQPVMLLIVMYEVRAILIHFLMHYGDIFK